MYTLGIPSKQYRRTTQVLGHERSEPIKYGVRKQDDGFYMFSFPGADEYNFKDIVKLLKVNGITAIGADDQLTEKKIMKLTNLINLESLQEIDVNDPALMRARAARDQMKSNPRIGFDQALDLRGEKKDLESRISQLYRDMEQEAEPEGGPISDQYADEITFYEDAIRLKKGPRKKDMPYDVAIGKMTQDEYDTIVSKDDFNKSSQFDRMNEGEWTYEFGELDESASTEEKRIALRAIKSIAKYRGVSEDEAKRDLIRAAKELGGLKEAINDVKETIKLGKTLNEELCAKGKAYRKKRMAAGEKSSAYLSGRAVRVCKGDIKG